MPRLHQGRMDRHASTEPSKKNGTKRKEHVADVSENTQPQAQIEMTGIKKLNQPVGSRVRGREIILGRLKSVVSGYCPID